MASLGAGWTIGAAVTQNATTTLGGTFDLAWGPSCTSVTIDVDMTLAQVTAVLTGLPNIGGVTVAIAGTTCAPSLLR
jgi:hypothetical protein